MSGDIVITAEQRKGTFVPTSAPWKHALDGIRGKSREGLAEAIGKRVTDRHLANDSDLHIVDSTGETIVHIPRSRLS